MTPVGDFGEDDRIFDFRKSRLKIRALVVHRAGTFLRENMKGAERPELDSFQSGADRAKKLSVGSVAYKQRGDRFKIEVDTNPTLCNVTAFKHNGLPGSQIRPTRKGIEFDDH